MTTNPLSTRNLDTVEAVDTHIRTLEQQAKDQEVGAMASRSIGCKTLAAESARKARCIRNRIETLKDRKVKMVEAFDPAI